MIGVNEAGRAGRAPRRYRNLFFYITIIASCFLLFSFHNSGYVVFIQYDTLNSPWHSRSHLAMYIRDRFTIQTEGCNITVMQPLSNDVKQYVKFPEKMSPCKYHNTSLLLKNNKTHIWIERNNLELYNITDVSMLSCCYKSFYRPAMIEDITSRSVDDRINYRDCQLFTDVIEVKDEFVRVICNYNNKSSIFEQFYLFAPKKEFKSHEDVKEFPKNRSGYNVIVMGIDAVSRLNFHRTMPKTVTFLKEKGAVELLGYNKVGDNTFPNLIPMLLGIRDTELKKMCAPTTRSTFDNCPFIWEWFKQTGYYTALVEDSSFLGTFNYAKVGFSNTPTDYYTHPFIHEAHKHVGNNKDFNSYLCMREKYFYKVLLDYVQDLTSTLQSSKLFGFFWEVTMSHDYLNYPMVMDNDYVDFFKNLDNAGYLKETIFFLVSDHGIRWGDIRSTKQGRLEERLPFVFILTPPVFRENYSEAYKNLILNSERLTTPFDVHETLSDLIDLSNVANEKIITRSENLYKHNKGISLFLPIPSNRTCRSAEIDDHWCTCHRGHKLSKISKEAKGAVLHLVKHLNELLSAYPQCSQLTLEETIEVTEMKLGSWIGENEGGVREYMVVVRTNPGGGVFEATLRNRNAEWSLAGTVSRLNLYGDQSRCVQHYQMKLYCYCNKL